MTTPRIRMLIFSALASACLLLWTYSLQRTTGSDTSSKLMETALAAFTTTTTTTIAKNNNDGLAYMTLLTGTMANQSDPNLNSDNYYVATRVLGYQLLHAPATRSDNSIPFIVLVTEDVAQGKRDRLAQDGATVVAVEYVAAPDWIVGEMPQWKDLMTKLRAWQLTQYSRVLFLDGDMILNAPLDGIFNDNATQPMKSLDPKGTSANSPAPVPSTYLLATVAEANPFHAYPPQAANSDYKDPDYFNAGFFVFAPSPALFDYYSALMNSENSFDPKYVEQNLLNHAHRQDGPLPWQRIDTAWNIRFPSLGDREAGVASMHDKFWHAHMDEKLQPYYDSVRWQMEGFYQAWDA